MCIVLKNNQGLKREGYKSSILAAMLNEEKRNLFGTRGVGRISRLLGRLGGFK